MDHYIIGIPFTLFMGFAINLSIGNNHLTAYIYLAITLLLSGLDVIIFIFLRKMNRTSQIEKERDIMEIQLQRQQDEMQHLQQQYEEISILRHDFRNGIDCLCGMIEQEIVPEHWRMRNNLRSEK